MKIRLDTKPPLGAFLLLSWLSAASATDGATLNVGPGYYSTIASALVDATDGDTITILVATQTECGIVIDKSVTIQGQGVNNTIVQGATSRSNVTSTSRIFKMVNTVTKAVTIKDLTLFERFVRLCAGRVGQLLNLQSLGNDVGISHTTARTWLTLLEASYVVFLLRPWHTNLSKRQIKFIINYPDIFRLYFIKIH